MSLLQMSVSGGLMIAVTVILRGLLRRFIPKRTFLVIWCVVILRLLVPYSLPCAFSVYSLSALECTKEPEKTHEPDIIIDLVIPENADTAPIAPAYPAPSSSPEIPAAPFVNIPVVIWLAGMILCAGYFTAAYIKSMKVFTQSLPAENDHAKRFSEEHRTLRRVSVRVSDRIKAPLTYGIFRPVILLPSQVDWIGNDDLKYVLTHEYVHIRRFDGAFKLALTAALCVHWFDPMVWLMYFLANRDIELSCDEAVVRTLGYNSRAAYAMTLIRMEENGVSVPIGNGFSKNAVEERIVMIMKLKKTTLPMIILSAFLVVGTTTAFATTAKTPSKAEGSDVTNEETYSAETLESGSNDTEAESTPAETAEQAETRPSEISESAEETTDAPAAAADAKPLTQSVPQEKLSPLKSCAGELDRSGAYTFIPANPEEEVYAVEDGTVFYAGYYFSYGNLIIIKQAEDHYTFYAHLNADNGIAVNTGDTVKAGQLIGYTGTSGAATQYGLGFEDRFEIPGSFTGAAGVLDPVKHFDKVEKRENSDGRQYTFYSAEHMAQVCAAESGTVVYTGEYGSYGNIVVTVHDDYFYDIYSHLEDDAGFAVKEGDIVEKGTLIGYVGNSGDTDEYGVGYENFSDAPPVDMSQYEYMIPVEGGFICR